MTTDTEFDEQLNSPLRNLVLRSSDPHYLKKLRVKRRRIRNYFGGVEAIKEIAVTVATVRNVVGIKLSASSGLGKPEVRTTESFIAGNKLTIRDDALYYSLILPLQLMLHGIKTTVYYEKRSFSAPENIQDPLFIELKNEFKFLQFIAVEKGQHLKQIREKLRAIHPNEVVDGYLEKIKKAVLGFIA